MALPLPENLDGGWAIVVEDVPPGTGIGDLISAFSPFGAIRFASLGPPAAVIGFETQASAAHALLASSMACLSIGAFAEKAAHARAAAPAYLMSHAPPDPYPYARFGRTTPYPYPSARFGRTTMPYPSGCYYPAAAIAPYYYPYSSPPVPSASAFGQFVPADPAVAAVVLHSRAVAAATAALEASSAAETGSRAHGAQTESGPVETMAAAAIEASSAAETGSRAHEAQTESGPVETMAAEKGERRCDDDIFHEWLRRRITDRFAAARSRGEHDYGASYLAGYNWASSVIRSMRGQTDPTPTRP